MIEKFIAKVPTRIWSEGRPPRARQWESEFNVASWVRVGGAAGQVQLVVRYMDDKNDHAVLVDTADVGGDGSALLSGMVRLRFTDAVEQVQISLRLADASMTHIVEELFMQRRGAALRPGDKLISNY
ncbi:hypothetical protein A11A3_08600 [Alcanivorax hongdengensis A-11-3]|uniref:Uncharacterized protein n=1 Tax=Alcanivorax hongdengensis A-11-3 TaxID=1177179 RepID=L0WE96_9GAMM|nr:hypothetical protein [Alcanivorax hongdengensis]EKF74467.1 hypothetical protein A11A3_08600 [Alcanivorax hongdengensis A-11-3]